MSSNISFKVGKKVQYKTPRMTGFSFGKLIAVHPTTRGDWFEVEDTATKDKIRVRAAGLAPA